ncbi:MAG: sugar phosphate isomerase/epimerase [Ruminococcaceae bacterium]|nr:sugar phosphate isomerase/epimerase [Oscillospiraceae bacterium]
MRIVTTTGVLPGQIGVPAILDRLKKCGFTDLDMSFYSKEIWNDLDFRSDRYEEWAYGVREEADKRGMRYYQGHSLVDVTFPKPKEEEKTFRCASILGIKYLVMHPHVNDWDKEKPGDQPYSHPFSREEFIELNTERYKRLMDLAEKHNLIILTENLLWGDGAKPTVMSELVEEVNSSRFGWCLDTGHAINLGIPLETVLECKHPPLSLHTHDCRGFQKEDHLIPGDGCIDWKKFMRLLKQIGYTGELVLEADHQPVAAPDHEKDAVIRRLYERAKELVTYYETL